MTARVLRFAMLNQRGSATCTAHHTIDSLECSSPLLAPARRADGSPAQAAELCAAVAMNAKIRIDVVFMRRPISN